MSVATPTFIIEPFYIACRKLFYVLFRRIAADIHFDEPFYFITADADEVIGKVRRRAGMIRNDADLVADLQIGRSVDVNLPDFFRQPVYA